VEGEDDAGSIFSWGKVGGVSEPAGREKNFTAVTDGIAGEFALEVRRGGDRAVRSAANGYATKDDMAEARHGDAAGPGAKGEAKDVVED